MQETRNLISGVSHSFDTGIAQICGLEAATIYNRIRFWIHENKINGRNQQEGRTWTYDTHARMAEYMPYLTERQVELAMNRLIDAGVLIKGNFNKSKFDRTNWYALPDESIVEIQKSLSIPRKCGTRAHKCEMEVTNPCLVYKDTLVDTQEEQQQQPKQAAAVFYDCLRNIEIPEADKVWLTKNYDEATVSRAIAWATHPSTKLKQTLQQALKWACANRPEVPKTVVDVSQENKAYAQDLVSRIESVPHARFEALNLTAEIAFPTAQRDPIVIPYSENDFKEQIHNALRKYGYQI